MKQLNVLFLSSWYPNEILNQNGNFVQQHARSVALYCNVAVLHVQSKSQKEKIKITKAYNEGVYEVIIYYKKIKSTSFLSDFLKIKIQHNAFLKGYTQILNEFKVIDLVHLNVILPAGFFALYLRKTYNIPFIITEHSTVYLDSNPFNHSIIERYIVKKITGKASVVCPVSNDLKAAMVNYGILGKFEVVYNVVNTKLFYFDSNNRGEKIHILHVSTLVNEHKNPMGILNVIKKLSLIRNDFIFQVIGDGDVESIEKYANQIGLDRRFYNFQNQKPSEKIAEAMQKSHLFIMFSNYENLPCVISESLVSGIPVISSDVGGINEMITKKNGILVKAGDENELLIKLNGMINDISNYDGEKIASEAILKYSYESIGKKFLSIYKKILDIE